MRRLYIVVEGQTEQEFVNTILYPYFYNYGIYSVTPILINTSKTGRGGFVDYNHLKKTIKKILNSRENDFVVTTFVDFFRIPDNLPNYEECIKLKSNKESCLKMEGFIDSDINDRRFFSYIQLHEFEALLFSNNKGFEVFFTEEQAMKTNEIVNAFDNPEEINSKPETAPSKRMLSIKSNYNKPIDGNLIALEIGISAMLERCPRFREWIQKLIKLCS